MFSGHKQNVESLNINYRIITVQERILFILFSFLQYLL